MKVKCNWCEWQGEESEIAFDEVDDTIEVCPKCHKSEHLMNIENKYAEEDLECALEDLAYWTAQNLDDPVPLIFRNDQIQKKYYELVKAYRDE